MVIWDYETVEIFYQNKKYKHGNVKNFRFGFKKRKEKAHEKVDLFLLRVDVQFMLFFCCHGGISGEPRRRQNSSEQGKE